MNVRDVLHYGHMWVHKHLEGLTSDQQLTPNVCGVWSTKDIIAHLASYEWLLVDAFSRVMGNQDTPLLEQLIELDGDTFNAVEVGKRRDWSPEEVIADYKKGYNSAIAVLPHLSEETLRCPGTIPWYGMEYDLEDFIVYQFYGHKREHCAQIAIYRDTLKVVG